MVSHGCGYFSECSVEQAQSIADRRIRLADELLQKYERERTLYSDKLEVPLGSEAFADGAREIIEEYDEEAEKRWREEHRQRVRESKQNEAKERAAKKNAPAEEMSDKELFAKLEEMELLEELENEMDQLELPAGEDGDDEDDQLGRLMRGEIRLNERKRVAHIQTNDSSERVSIANFQSIEQHKENDQNTVQEEEVEEEIETTDDEEDVENEEEDDDISTEFSQLLLETKNYSQKDKIKVFQVKLKDVRQRLYQNSIDLVQKVDLYQLHDELEEALDFMLPSNESVEDQSAEKPLPLPLSGTPASKKIQFAEEDQIKLIRNRHQDHNNDEQGTKNDESNNTLFIPIKHSVKYYTAYPSDEIQSPADIYRSFLEESLKHSPTVELKSILKAPKTTDNGNTIQGPSVAKQPTCRPGKKPPSPVPDVIGEVVEHTVAMSDVKPPEQKKKVSRFKLQRK
uniref:Uncharacterized protein n=1 Tax=Anopheles epiroticus TaxID=199890 RepID=A0A182P3I8_9DIPT